MVRACSLGHNQIMATLFSLLWTILATLISILWWIVSTLLWVIVWFLLPFLIVAFIALRLAEKAFGQEAVRAWVKSKALLFGAGTWERVRPWLFALGVAPFRVLLWFIAYTIWHALVSLFWRPKWSPWTRAWGRRWKPVPRTPSGRAVKAKG